MSIDPDAVISKATLLLHDPPADIYGWAAKQAVDLAREVVALAREVKAVRAENDALRAEIEAERDNHRRVIDEINAESLLQFDALRKRIAALDKKE